MKAIIQRDITKMEESRKSLWDPVNISSSQHRNEMPCLYGENLKMIAGKKESIVRSSEMKATSYPRTLSERLTPLLISHGLVKGTTRTFGLRLLNRGIPVGVLYAPDGGIVDMPKQACIF